MTNKKCTKCEKKNLWMGSFRRVLRVTVAAPMNLFASDAGAKKNKAYYRAAKPRKRY